MLTISNHNNSFSNLELVSSHPKSKPVNSTEIDLPLGNQFHNLILKLKNLLNGKGLSAADIDINKVEELMNSYTSNPLDWNKFALYNPALPYTRNGIININGNANLLILVWGPNQSSAIHDHAKAHCVMKILKGSLTEHLYKIPSTTVAQMEQTKQTTYNKNQVAYISDDIGLHKISNSTNELAISLHLYTPPYAANFGCNRYDDQGHKFHVDMSKYYSWQGDIVDTNASNC